jgi:ankyrin repeat protein
VVAVLLAAGADPNAGDGRGVTPLEIAETSYSTSALELLRAASTR